MVNYLSVTDTAKLVREALKKAYPSVKFSVRSSSYAGGTSIDVSWKDGPREKDVEKVAKAFEGATFDGMIDLKSYHRSMLNGQEVYFGADYVSCRREITNIDKLAEEAEALIRRRCAIEQDDRFGGYFVSDQARMMAREIDFLQGDTMEVAFERIIMRRCD